MSNIELFPVIVPLDVEDYELAKKFASTANTSTKSKQVYFNTLAVLAVKNFLTWMEIDTDLSKSEIYNPIVRNFSDVADLVISGLGRLECRPVLPGETAIYLPPEAQENRIACVAVLLDEKSSQAELLGCYLSQEQEELLDTIEINSLHQLDILLDHFNWLEKISIWGGLTNLKHILEGLLDKGWEKDISADLESENISRVLNFRSNIIGHNNDINYQENIQNFIEKLNSDDFEVRQIVLRKLGEIGINNPDIIAALIEQLEAEDESIRWEAAFSLGKIVPDHPQAGVRLRKKIDIGVANTLILVISSRADRDNSTRLRVQIYPDDSQTYLPNNCKLSILDESETVFGQEILSQENDDYIQRSFNVESGDYFGIKVEVCNQSYVEFFVG